MENRHYQLKDQQVQPGDPLKLAGLAGSGGLGKHMVAREAASFDEVYLRRLRGLWLHQVRMSQNE